ncbi:MAG TPA: hypothetical protein VNM48_15720 [Chloroflexota bacterium]|nr:hypothetical protein [Chloroflexota bacterium]
MSLLSQQSDGRDDALVRRIAQAAVAAALVIQAEPAATANHANRATYAKLVLNAPDTYAPLFALAAVADGATTTASTDTALANRVNAIFNALAGTL